MPEASVASSLDRLGPTHIAWVVLGVVGVLAGLLVLVYPGPLALTDRIPVALLLAVPGAFGVYHAYAESQSPL